MFAEATRKAAEARFKKKTLDAEGQEIQVRYNVSGLSFTKELYKP